MINSKAATQEGCYEDSDVCPQTSVLQIFCIHRREAFWIRHIDTANLREACDAGAYRQNIAPFACLDQSFLRWQTWSRADKTHLAQQHVEELR